MSYNTQGGGKGGGNGKAEIKPEPEEMPGPSEAKRGRKRGRKRKIDSTELEFEMVSSSTSMIPTPGPSTSDSTSDFEYNQSRILPNPTVAASSGENTFSRANEIPTACLSDCLFEDDGKSDDFEIEISEYESIDIRCSQNVSSDLLSLNTNTSFEETLNRCVKSLPFFQEEASGGKEEATQEEDKEEKAGESRLRPVSDDLLVKNDWPFKNICTQGMVKRLQSPFTPLTVSQEDAILADLEERMTEGEQFCVADKRLYKKLKGKHWKKERKERREKNAMFDPPDDYFTFWVMIETNRRIPFDPYQYDYLKGSKEQYSCLSPYTKRTLKPFMVEDYDTTPLWLRLIDELRRKANKKNPTCEPPPRSSIVRPHHLPAKNSLAELYFWPGINLTECLRCPDFSCVVFYKEPLIGFTIAFTDLFRIEIYIAFIVVRRERQGSGISSKGRDMTLPVSPINSYLILYLIFGFTVVYFEWNFYSRYLPPD